MTSKNGPGAEADQASVVLASFDSYRHAEHMLATLGQRFRAEARKGDAVGSDEQQGHRILAQAGPNAALVLVRCDDEKIKQRVTTAAEKSAIQSWDGPLSQFLAALDPGDRHDWVRDALGKTSTTPQSRPTHKKPQ